MEITVDQLRTPDLPEAAVALKDDIRRNLDRLQRGFGALTAAVEGLDPDLSPEARAKRKKDLRDRFREDFMPVMVEIRKAAESAEIIAATNCTRAAIEARAIGADPAKAAAVAAMLEGLTPTDLQGHAVESFRVRDFATGTAIAREARTRLDDGSMTNEEAAVIIQITEGIAVPAAELAARAALERSTPRKRPMPIPS